MPGVQAKMSPACGYAATSAAVRFSRAVVTGELSSCLRSGRTDAGYSAAVPYVTLFIWICK